jgi:hypothetical protein
MAKSWVNRAKKAYRMGTPPGPQEPSPPIHQKRVQLMLQLIYANRALALLRANGVKSGPLWNQATQLRNWAIFARNAAAAFIKIHCGK